MSASSFKVFVAAGDKVSVPTEVEGPVRNLLQRIGGRFKFKDKDQFRNFTDKRIIPSELLALFQDEIREEQRRLEILKRSDFDVWVFLTRPNGPTKLITHRMQMAPNFHANGGARAFA